MRKCVSVLLAVLLIIPAIQAQTITGSCSGQILDASSGKPLEGAQVSLRSGDVQKGAVCDLNGRFQLEELPVGLYKLVVSALSYEAQSLDDVWIRSGKKQVIEIALKPIAFELPDVEVGAERIQIPTLGTRSFTIEQSLRYAATFSDPARLVANFAGVAISNDQANHFSVRGNSPNANKWYIEGMEVVSPNHLSGAGTISDLPSLSGGGVNMLSTQMLDRSSFKNGPLNLQYGNATGGIMDMRLRKGSDTSEWTAQAGLIGIDISNEGSFGANSKSTYLVNYRYSTLGVLSAMGVDLGDELIQFQDLAFTLNFPIGKTGELSVFGTGGISSNDFEAIRDTSMWEVDKDSLDINYASEVAIGGVVFTSNLGDNTSLKLGTVYSTSDQLRDQQSVDENYGLSSFNNYSLTKTLLSTQLGVEQKFGKRLNTYLGVVMLSDKLITNALGSTSEIEGNLIRVHTQNTFAISPKMSLDFGAGLAYWNLSQSSEPEFNLGYGLKTGKRGSIVLRAGRRTQQPMLANLLDDVSYSNSERAPLMVSEELELGYSNVFKSGMTGEITAFYQQISGIPSFPIFLDPVSSFIDGFTLFNTWNEIIPVEALFNSSATSYGVELSANRPMQDGHYFFGNASVFESSTEIAGFSVRDSRWDIGFSSNWGYGKEFVKQKEGLIRTLGVSATLALNGGARYRAFNGESRGYKWGDAAQFPMYNRLDLRIYWKKDRATKTGMWAIDIQNALNTQNAFYEYYDQRSQEVLTQSQLGIIPNLSYRIEF